MGTLTTPAFNAALALDQAENPKDMYQHAIPRFILRQFDVRSLSPSSPAEDEQHSWKTGKRSHSIHFYDLVTGELAIRGLRSVYGRINLYRNLRESTDVDYLEHKLGDLEHSAASVIRAIHVGIPSGAVSLTRAELATLRKFIFLMHYRSAAASATYFHENNPLNAPLADWIKKFKKTRKLKTEVDVWQEGLKYYLDTPHHVIVATGESLRERYGDHRLYEMLRKRFDPDIEEWYAVDYESQANYFFLGVWEAADGAEFVLTGNGFGLWEGLIYGSPGAHRIYVVSPRIALVLRRTFLRQPHSNDPSIVYSNLVNIPISQPQCTFAQEFLKDVDPDDPAMIAMAGNAYRVTPAAQNDRFTFSFTKLSIDQTYSVNEALLMNVNLQKNGSVTFKLPQTMLHTLERYTSSPNTYLGGKKESFKPLLLQLLGHKFKKAKKMISTPTKVGSTGQSPETNTEADRLFTMFLRSLVSGRLGFPSTYTRAYLVYHMATSGSSSNSVSLQICRIRDDAITKLQSVLDPPLPPVLSPTCPTSPPSIHSKAIVETLPKAESELFFGLVGHLIDSLVVGGYSNDLLANVIYEASIIGVSYWLAKEREDVLMDLLEPWVCILV